MFPGDSASLAALQFGDAAAVVAAIISGAHIVRVHDVEQILPAVRIADAVTLAGGRGAPSKS